MYEELSIYAFDSKFKFTVDLTAPHRHKHKEVTSLPLLIMRAYVLERPLTNNAGLRFGTAAQMRAYVLEQPLTNIWIPRASTCL